MTERTLSFMIGLSNLGLAMALAGLLLNLRVLLVGGLVLWVAAMFAVGLIDHRIVFRQRRERQRRGG